MKQRKTVQKPSTVEQLLTSKKIIASNPDLDVLVPLGFGNYGYVWLAHYQNEKVAVKSPSPYKDTHGDKLRDEVTIMQQLNSDYIVKCIRVYNSNSANIHAVFELCPSGSLQAWIGEFKNCSTLEQIQVAKQIALGVSYIHINGFLHMDLKPDNILFDAYGNAKIADFGFPVAKDQVKMLKSTERSRGTAYWIAPERLLPPYTLNEETDVWSLSVILMQIVNGSENPFGHMKNRQELFTHLMTKPLPDINTPDAEFREIIASGLRLTTGANPQVRPKAIQIAASLTAMFKSLNKQIDAVQTALNSCPDSTVKID